MSFIPSSVCVCLLYFTSVFIYASLLWIVVQACKIDLSSTLKAIQKEHSSTCCLTNGDVWMESINNRVLWCFSNGYFVSIHMASGFWIILLSPYSFLRCRILFLHEERCRNKKATFWHLLWHREYGIENTACKIKL